MLPLIWIANVVALSVIALGSPSHAQTTMCMGDVCTVTSNDGSTLQMSADEIAKKAREEALENIREIDCSAADDAAECLKAKLKLRRLFY